MYNVWTLKGTCTFVHIFVSKSSVNCVTKKEEIIIKKIEMGRKTIKFNQRQ